MLPVVIDGGYDLSLEFVRSRCRDGIVILLPVGHSQGRLWIGGWGGGVSGLDGIDDKSAYNNNTTRRNDTFVIGRSYALLVQVRVQGRTGSITAILDGTPFIQWIGRISSLSLSNDWKLPQPNRPGLAAHEDPVSFQTVKLRAVSGKVSFVRGENVTAPVSAAMTISGKWAWGSGQVVEFQDDGTANTTALYA